MTYQLDPRGPQYVTVAAGGSDIGGPGDAMVTVALERGAGSQK